MRQELGERGILDTAKRKTQTPELLVEPETPIQSLRLSQGSGLKARVLHLQVHAKFEIVPGFGVQGQSFPPTNPCRHRPINTTFCYFSIYPLPGRWRQAVCIDVLILFLLGGAVWLTT